MSTVSNIVDGKTDNINWTNLNYNITLKFNYSLISEEVCHLKKNFTCDPHLKIFDFWLSNNIINIFF